MFSLFGEALLDILYYEFLLGLRNVKYSTYMLIFSYTYEQEMEQKTPSEINDHFKIFGKNVDEVDYNSVGPCPLCGSRVDEFNFCACGGKFGCD
jgi:hypothetical protein